MKEEGEGQQHHNQTLISRAKTPPGPFGVNERFTSTNSSFLLLHTYRWLVLLLWRKTAFKPEIVNCKPRPKSPWPKICPPWPQPRTFSADWAALTLAPLLAILMSQVRQQQLQQPMGTIIWIIIQGIKILVKWPIPPNSTHIIWPVLALRPFSAPDQQRPLRLKLPQKLLLTTAQTKKNTHL